MNKGFIFINKELFHAIASRFGAVNLVRRDRPLTRDN